MDVETLRIFHPTDLLADSEPALAHAVRLLAAGAVRLSVLHVADPNHAADWTRLPSPIELLERWNLLEGQGPNIEQLEVHSDSVVRSVLHHLEQSPTDLIVLATHGRRGWDAWFSGSLAEPIARIAHAMTLFVRKGCRGFVDPQTGAVRMNKVLIPMVVTPSSSGSIWAARALTTALGFPDTQLTACFVGDPGDAPLVPDDVPMVFRTGSLPDAVVGLATELDVDLIVMATEGRRGLVDSLLGSTTERVLREAPCPVLAVPATEIVSD